MKISEEIPNDVAAEISIGWLVVQRPGLCMKTGA
jgi:hypothetical protein